MALRRRDVVLASITCFVVWGYAVDWAPSLRWVGYAFTTGLTLPILGLIAVVLLTSRVAEYDARNRVSRPGGPAFLSVTAWRAEVTAIRSREDYIKQPLYAESFIVSSALDELLELVLHDFVNSWYLNISSNPSFTNEVDKAIRIALGNIRDRIFGIDLVDAITMRFVPIMTAHFKDFYDAERAVRGKHLNRNVTESEELDLAIAGKYNDGKLHPAASLAYSDMRLVQQEYLRNIAKKILPKVITDRMTASRAASILVEELVGCAVLYPVMRILSDPDTWNQVMEAYVC
jgi:sorting nexin-25